MQKIHAVAVAGLLLSVACGDEEGSTGGSQSNLDMCERICARASSQHCGPVSEQDCADACMTQDAETPVQCKGQVEGFMRCAAKADYRCDANTGNAVALGCLDELDALTSCVGRYGVDEPETDAGITPRPVADGGFPGKGDTGSPGKGGDAGLPTQGGGKSPGEGAVCAPSAGDDACDRCIGASCCAENSACAADAGCRKVSECLSACGEQDDACQQACVDGLTPSTARLFSATLSCFAQKCSSVCGVDTSEPSPSEPSPGQNEDCLPTAVPPGYCTDAKRPVGRECVSKPAGDCVALENVSDVYCCAS